MTTPKSPNSSFLRAQRIFPQDPQMLSVEINKAYIDTAAAVNNRVVSIFSEDQNIINGKTFFFGGIKYQGFQRIYLITATGNTPHLLDTSNIFSFSSISGIMKSGSNFYPLPYVDSTAANNQVSLSITPTNIVITPGGGSPPAFTSAIVTLEWLVAT